MTLTTMTTMSQPLGRTKVNLRGYDFNIRRTTGQTNLVYQAMPKEKTRMEKLIRRNVAKDKHQSLGDKRHFFTLNLFINNREDEEDIRLFKNITNMKQMKRRKGLLSPTCKSFFIKSHELQK